METSVFENFHRHTGDRAVTDILADIGGGRYAAPVNNLRDALRRGDTVNAEQIKKRLPAFTLSASYRGRRVSADLAAYSGVVMLDIDKLEPGRAEALKEQAAALPHTLFAFVSPGGCGLKIGVLPVVGHPVTAENHRETFCLAQRFYEERLGTPIDPSGKDMGRLCFVSYDPQIYVHPRHLSFLRGESPACTDGLARMEAAMQAGPDNDAADPAHRLSRARKYATRTMKYEEGNRNNYLFLFASQCNRLGVEREEMLAYCRKHFPDMDGGELDTIAQSAYSHTEEYDTVQEKKTKKKERCARLMEEMKRELSEEHHFRFNTVTCRVEWRKKKSRKKFAPMDDVKENSLWCRLQEKGIACSRNDLHAVLASDFSPAFDPFADYFLSLPAWDGETDYIARLADTVQTTRQELWHDYFRKWLVAMVAAALDEEVVNHTVLLLCSEQGLGKTKWITGLLPPELKGYRYSGLPNLQSKDAMLSLSECLLINLDELEVLSPKDLGMLKDFVTKGVLRERRAYGHNIENYVRRASLAAAVNSHQILTDLTGLRRFLCFTATGIDYTVPVDYTGVYSQAVALLKSDFRYWFDASDFGQINENNEQFRLRTPEEEFFYTYFRKPEPKDIEIKYLSSTEIVEYICGKTNLHLTHGGVVRMGQLLKRDGFGHIKKRNKYVYAVIEIPIEEVDMERRRK